MSEQAPETWREYLRMIARDPAESARIIKELGINKVTLGRWMRGDHTPLPRTIAQLLRILPQGQREEMLRLLVLDGNFSTYAFAAGYEPPEREQEAPLEISSDFYAEALRLPEDTPDLFWQVSGFIMDKIIGLLDPPRPWRSGLELIVARCTLPSDGIVRSLQEAVGMGTEPWQQDQNNKQLFLGGESLVGYAVSTGRYRVVNDCEGLEGLLFPFLKVPHERSEAAFPILLQNRVAGALSVASTQAGFFTVQRITLLQRFAHLLRMAFASDEFYPLSSIQLRTMPPWPVQQTYFDTVPQRMTQLLLDAQREDLQPALPSGSLLTHAARRVNADLEDQLIAWQAGATDEVHGRTQEQTLP
jgi:GAF domain